MFIRIDFLEAKFDMSLKSRGVYNYQEWISKETGLDI